MFSCCSVWMDFTLRGQPSCCLQGQAPTRCSAKFKRRRNTHYASQLKADSRQIARAEARLAELGFIVKSSAARCRRYGVMSENVIRYAFGINLAPLVDRAREIETAERRACFEKEEAKRLRLHIPKLLELVRTSGDASAEEAAEVILPPRRFWRYARLKEIADALEALIKTLADVSVAVEMSDRCDANVAPREGRKQNQKK